MSFWFPAEPEARISAREQSKMKKDSRIAIGLGFKADRNNRSVEALRDFRLAKSIEVTDLK
jgi:hypothetical protein